MLRLFRTRFHLMPLLLALTLMIFLRINVVLSDINLQSWLGGLAPFSQLLNYIFGLELIQNPVFNVVLTSFIVLIQAAIISSIVGQFNEKKLNNLLPAWIYILLMHIFPDFVFLSPTLISITFVLIAIRKLMAESNMSSIFISGLFISIASMFWTPSIFYLLFVLVYIWVKRIIDSKVILLILIGVLIPIFYVVSYYIFIGEIQWSLDIFHTLQWNNFDFELYPWKKMHSVSILILILLSSIYHIPVFLSKQLQKIKEFVSLLNYFLLFSFLALLFQSENTISVWMVFLFPFAIIINIIFNTIKRQKFAEIVHLILFLSIIINFMFFLN